MNNVGLHPYSLNNSGANISPLLSSQNPSIGLHNESPLKTNRESQEKFLQKQLSATKDQQKVNSRENSYHLSQRNDGPPKYLTNQNYSIQSKVNGHQSYSVDMGHNYSNQFSTPEPQDHNRNGFNQGILSPLHWKENLQISNNISTIKAKSMTGSQLSLSNHLSQNLYQNQYSVDNSGMKLQSVGDGARLGQDQRQKLFTLNNDHALIVEMKATIEDSPHIPESMNLSEKMKSSINNDQNFFKNERHSMQQFHEKQQFNQNTAMLRKDSANAGTQKTGTIAYTNRSQKRLWSTKWMVMSLYISNSIRKFKKTLTLSKPNYLSKEQMLLINDKSAYYEHLRENKEKRYQGWLFNNDGPLARKQKKRILILLKKFKMVKSTVLLVLRELTQRVNRFDLRFPPMSPLLLELKIFDGIVFCLTMYLAIFIPIFLCFSEEIHSEQINSTFVTLMNQVAPIVFIVDIVKYLNTCCFIRGQMISDRLQIFTTYLQERFVCDALCIVSLIFYTSKTELVLLLFYARFYFTLQMVSKMRELFLLKDRMNACINIGVLVFLIYFFAHIFACVWFYVGVQEKEHANTSWIITAQIESSSFYEKYLCALYFALSQMTTLNSSITPVTFQERLFVVVINCFTLTMLGYVFHEASQIFERVSLNRRNYLNQLRQIDRYMSDHNVSEYYQSLARKYLQYVTSEGLENRQVSAEKNLQGLSLQLKEDIIKNSFLRQLKEIRVFSRYFSEQFLEKLALKMGEQIIGPDEYVSNLNRIQHPKIYIVKKGQIEFFAKIGTQRTDKSDSLKSFRVFKENEYFGTYEFFSDTYKPHLSARSIGVSIVQYINLDDFLQLLDEFPEEREAYIYIKEMVTIYQKYDTIGVACYSCGEKDHQTLSCPQLFYDKQRSDILKRIDQENNLIVRNYRRNKGSKFNCRSNCKKIYNSQDRFVIDNVDWLQTQSSMVSFEVEDNLQLNNIDLPKLDSQHLDSYFHIRGKASSIGTMGTFRVREEKQPGDINGIYFDSELDAYSINSHYKSNATRTQNEYDWAGNQSHVSINNIQTASGSAPVLAVNAQTMNTLMPKIPSNNSAFDDDDQAISLTRKMHSKLTASPSKNSMLIPSNKMPELKYRAKSTHIKPISIGDSLMEDSQSQVELKSIGAKSPRPNTVLLPSQKQESGQPSLMRRNTTKTRNRVQSFNLDQNAYRDNTTPWREPTHRSLRKTYEQSLFSQTKLDMRTVENISEEESSLSEDEEQENVLGAASQRSYSYKDNARSDRQSRRSEKRIEEIQNENINSYAYISNNFSTVHSFRIFFPHNNVENVLEFLNKKSRGWRRARSKRLTKKLSHKSFKKQSSLRSKKRPLLLDNS